MTDIIHVIKWTRPFPYILYTASGQKLDVVKYKLDKMRKAIEAEEKKVCVWEGGSCCEWVGEVRRVLV